MNKIGEWIYYYKNGSIIGGNCNILRKSDANLTKCLKDEKPEFCIDKNASSEFPNTHASDAAKKYNFLRAKGCKDMNVPNSMLLFWDKSKDAPDGDLSGAVKTVYAGDLPNYQWPSTFKEC